MNIADTLNEGTNILKKNKIINPQLDVEILLSKLIKKDKKYLILNSKEVLSFENLDIFKNLIERRRKGEPIAYLINQKEFWKNEKQQYQQNWKSPDFHINIYSIFNIYYRGMCDNQKTDNYRH